MSCWLCTNGPCRINEKSGATKGVCGIGPDAMAMRNMLIRNIMGAATYGHHAYEAFRTLKATGEGKTPFQITDKDKLQWLCETVGIGGNGDVNRQAVALAEFFNAEMKVTPDGREDGGAVCAAKENTVWKQLNIYPSVSSTRSRIPSQAA
jgi:carbon-monoxide dehydrogenase catalytic subunit